MIPSSFRPLLILAGMAGSAMADRPPGEAAATFADKLPTGCIVTGESIDGKTSYSVTGKAEPADIAPEKRVFEIGSITKVFTGLLLAEAVLEKRLRLDSTLQELLGKNFHFADPKVARITLLQLSTHTSGLPRLPNNIGPDPDASDDPYGKYDRKLMNAFLATAKLEGDGPYPASYSNFGVGLLGEILADSYHKSWETLVKEKITVPLGMKDTMMTLGQDQLKRLAPPYRGDKPNHRWTFQAVAGAGGLHSTAADLLLFGQAMIDPDKTPISAAIKGMMKSQAHYGDVGADIGLGILISKIDGETEYSHGGGTGGYRSIIQVIPGKKTVRVALIDNDCIPAEAVVAATHENKDAAAAAPEQKLTPAELDAYTGIYEAGSSRFTVLRRDDHLHVRLTGQSFNPVVALGNDRFRYIAIAAEIQFSREGGSVKSLTLFQNGREIPAKRLDEKPPGITFPPEEELKAYAGEYELAPGKVITVTPGVDSLFAQLTGQPAVPVFQTKPGYFEYDIVKAALEFEKDSDGKVTGLILHQNGDYRAKKR